MILDIIIVAIIVLSALLGFKKGFAATVIHTAGWLVALIVAFIGTPKVTPFLKENLGFYDWLQEGFAYRFDSATGIEASQESLPGGLGSAVTDLAGGAAKTLTTAFADLVFSVVVFLVIFIIVKIILWILLHLVSKHYNERASIPDGIIGLIFGILRGFVLVFIFLAVLMPAMNVMAPDFTSGVMASIDNSFITKTLYDNNILLMLIQSKFVS